MPPDKLMLPDSLRIKQHVTQSLHRYWLNNAQAIEALPITPIHKNIQICLPLKLISVELPNWASLAGINGELLIPQELIPEGGATNTQPIWAQIDWFMAVFLMLEAWHERLWEERNSPIHSYSFRLKGWDDRVWAHSWVNRIGLFLREWAAHRAGCGSDELFGPLQRPNILMTHDVDALEKTLAIRLKQSAFIGFNALKQLAFGNIKISFQHTGRAAKFLFVRDNWWQFDRLLQAEAQAKISSLFHFHADPRRKSLKRWIFDPNYDIQQPRVKALIRRLHSLGHTIGLHPGFDSWNNPEAMAEQKQSLESTGSGDVLACRQHWLRFSWERTWSTQERAGFASDTTLMFNDRPGFRNATALCWKPWNAELADRHQLTAQPTVVMDSHLYDYQQIDDAERRSQLNKWITEITYVHGSAAVLWHPHTLARDYGWSDGFSDLLNILTRKSTA